jgi:hypothetical protein
MKSVMPVTAAGVLACGEEPTMNNATKSKGMGAIPHVGASCSACALTRMPAR